jgi:hypothetical protein
MSLSGVGGAYEIGVFKRSPRLHVGTPVVRHGVDY